MYMLGAVPLSLNKGNFIIYKKKRIGTIMFTISMGNQDLSMIWKILKILNILMGTFYLMFPPLMMENFLLL